MVVETSQTTGLEFERLELRAILESSLGPERQTRANQELGISVGVELASELTASIEALLDSDDVNTLRREVELDMELVGRPIPPPPSVVDITVRRGSIELIIGIITGGLLLYGQLRDSFLKLVNDAVTVWAVASKNRRRWLRIRVSVRFKDEPELELPLEESDDEQESDE